jgi:hypothetical protein
MQYVTQLTLSIPDQPTQARAHTCQATPNLWGQSMKRKRCAQVYILRIWREPSDLAPPGEWRGTLRSADGRREWHFRSAQELWGLLVEESSSSAGKQDATGCG